MEMPRLLWAYLGPENTLPLASLLGAAVGVLLIFWHCVVGWLKKLIRLLFTSVSATDAASGRSVQAVPVQERRPPARANVRPAGEGPSGIGQGK